MVKNWIKGPCSILDAVFVTKIGSFQLLTIVTGDLILDAVGVLYHSWFTQLVHTPPPLF